MKTKLFLTVALLLGITMSAQEEFKQIDNFTVTTETTVGTERVRESTTYEIYVKVDDDNKTFKIRIAKSASESAESVSMVARYDENLFLTALTTVMKDANLAGSSFVLNDDTKAQWRATYSRLTKQITERNVITELYDNPDIEYSGHIVLHDKVKLTKDSAPEASTGEQRKKILARRGETPEDGKTAKELVVESASIRFYNNRVNVASVVGKIDGKYYTIMNNLHSVPFRYLNRNGSYLVVTVDEKDYIMQWNDLLDYRPEGTEFNYAVKNKNYALKPNQKVKIESRNMFDYFTAIVFSDFLGLNNEGDNNLVVAEGRVVIPLALVNKGRWNMPQYFEGYLNTSLYSGQDDGAHFALITDPPGEAGPEKISPFEFFKKRNIEAGLNLGLVSFEWRGIASVFTFDYGLQFYRTKLRYIKEDETSEDFQVYSIGHGPKLKVEIRPQVNFGADLNIGLTRFNFNSLNKSIDFPGGNGFRKDALTSENTLYNNFYIVSNFYTKLNDREKNSGIYFRLGAHYDFDTYEIAPQIMFGYATNLTSFINKFKAKDEKKAIVTSTETIEP